MIATTIIFAFEHCNRASDSRTASSFAVFLTTLIQSHSTPRIRRDRLVNNFVVLANGKHTDLNLKQRCWLRDDKRVMGSLCRPMTGYLCNYYI